MASDHAPKGLFVTGTDTGVGKSYVACAIASALRGRGVRVGVMKPIETGCEASDDGSLAPSDALALASASGDGDPIEQISPYTFAEPLAPWIAADRTGSAIDPSRILAVFRNKSARFDFSVVEGAGGLLVPIRADFLMLDLVLGMRLPIVIVAANRLGALNHTLLTVRVAVAAGLQIAGVILNEPRPDPTLAASTNGRVLRKLLKVPFLGEIHHRPDEKGTLPEVGASLLSGLGL